MTILMQIKKDQMAARKTDNLVRRNLLTTLYAEITMLGKNVGNRQPEEITDEETISVIKKFIKGAEESYQLYELNGRPDRAAATRQELEILNGYLPEQLSEEDLEKIVRDFLASAPQGGKQLMGQVMKELNRTYQGRFDGKKASTIIARMIQSGS